MGGKLNESCLFFLFFGGRVLGEFGGNGGKAIKRPSKGTNKHNCSLIFDEKTLIYIHFRFF